MADSLLLEALAYAKSGFFIHPLKERSKEPASSYGFKDAVNNEEQIKKWWSQNEKYNIGLRVGKESDVWVLDVDGEYGLSDYRTLIHRHGSIGNVPFQSTARGTHFFFKYDERIIAFNGQKLFKHPTNKLVLNSKGAPSEQGIDLKIRDGYVVLAPSVHPDTGLAYTSIVDPRLVKPIEAPEWLIQIIIDRDSYIAKWGEMEPRPDKTKDLLPSKKKISIFQNSQERFSDDDVADMLSCLDPDMGRDEWIRVGLALHHGGYDFDIFDSWSSSNGATKYDRKKIVREWNSFQSGSGITMGTLVHMAKLNGWSYHSTALYVPTASPPAIIPTEENTKGINDNDGFDISDIDGLIGDTVRDVCKSAFIPQPYLALLNVLSFAGALFGGRYSTPLGGRSNLYTIGVAPTGMGKDASRKYITALANTIGRDELIGSNALRSASGLAQEVKVNPNVLLQIDEFGLFMKGLADEKAPSYVRELSKLMLILYSSSDSVYNHGCYADTKVAPIVVQNPNLCIYGTTTLDNWTESLTSANVKSGELNRFIVMPSTVTPKNNHNKRFDIVDMDIANRWSELSAPRAVLSNKGVVSVIRAKWGAGVQKASQDMADYQLSKIEHTQTGALWARYLENSIKIALIFAVCRDPLSPVISEEDLTIGSSIVSRSISFMEKIVSENMSESPFEKELNKVMDCINRAGPTGVTKTALYRQFKRLKSKGVDEVIIGLIEAGMIEARNIITDGAKKPTLVYFSSII